MPGGLIVSAKAYIYNSRADLCQAINKLLKQPNVRERLKLAIGAMISNNLNSLVAAFVKADTVYNKLTAALEDYLKEDENQKNVAMMINDGLQKLLEDRIGELLKKISEEDRASLTTALVDMLAENLLTDTVIANVLVNWKMVFLNILPWTISLLVLMRTMTLRWQILLQTDFGNMPQEKVFSY